MCGILGVISGQDARYNHKEIELMVNTLFILSESRGKEASGIASLTTDAIYVAKHAVPASKMIGSKDHQDIYAKAFDQKSPIDNKTAFPVCIIGHSRLVTDGAQQIHRNNQPAISNGMVAVHNGIITNVGDLWEKFSALKKETQLDTEILLTLIRKFFSESGNLIQSVRKAYCLIEGVASIAVLFEDLNVILLATNNGSLYLGRNDDTRAYIFASERYILESLYKKKRLLKLLENVKISHIESNTGCLINLENRESYQFSLDLEEGNEDGSFTKFSERKRIIDLSARMLSFNKESPQVQGKGLHILQASFVDEYPQDRDAVSKLRRCTKCVLPETMPFIQFDKDGICNYCNNYYQPELLGVEALQRELEPYRASNGGYDCLVTFSGGRDSSYGVHFIKNVLKLNPITYTYDWGMVTDLARRNQMRICGKLGIEHILVSADIGKKRKNIKKNVNAWLKKPDLGMIPLFMAGDKQYFYYANKIGKQTGCKAIVLCENLLETTQFKWGFNGIAPHYAGTHVYSTKMRDKIRMALYYGKQFVLNPAYINSSINDTVWAYISFYFINHNYLNIYRYVDWDENEINNILINEYNWETATNTKSTWRIGDGTASFYNYIYYTMAGFTENDTFRSNQIRKGTMNREHAIKLVEKENEPRYESIQWYCDIVGIDFEETIKIVNNASKLYHS